MNIICTSKLHIDDEKFFRDYLSWCEVLRIDSSDRASIDRFVDDYFCSVDDKYFHADNAIEVKEALTGIIVAGIKGVKDYLIMVGTHPTAGSVFKFFKNYESSRDDFFAISPLHEDRYEHCILKEWENQLCKCGEGFEFYFYRAVDEITPEVLITLNSDFSLALQNPHHKVINGEVL